MQASRLLLLFAFLLLLSALAASVQPAPRPGGTGQTTPPAPAPPGDARAAVPGEVRFDASRRRRTARVRTGERVVVSVAVDEPGDVLVPGLGLVQTAEYRTPAVFDLLLDEPARHDVRFRPVAGAERLVGTLVVER